MKFSRRNSFTFFLAALLATWGCDSAGEKPAEDDLVIHSSSFLAGAPGEEVGPLVAQVLGPVIQGVPGRNGSRDPVPGIKVEFKFKGEIPKLPVREESEIQPPAKGKKAAAEAEGQGENDDLAPSPSAGLLPRFVSYKARARAPGEPPGAGYDASEISNDGLSAAVRTDENGYARVGILLGRFIGEFRVVAEIRNRLGLRRPVEFWLVSGVKILADQSQQREGPVNHPVRVAVQVFRVEGDKVLPENNRTVYFRSVEEIGDSGGARLEKEKDKTNQEGTATVNLLLGKRSGTYHVLAEVEPDEKSPPLRGLKIEFYALDWIEIALEALGGIAFFIFGLRLLGSGLIVQLSPVLHLPTGALSRSPLAGFLGGTVIGAVFQSSTAVISRLVSFANGGLLTASGAAGQILGADLGKTGLIQILAFDSISLLGVPLIAAGTFLYFLPGRFGSRSWGNILLGSGIALLGWQFLQATSDLVKISPSLQATIRAWDPGAGSRSLLTALVVFCADALLALAASFVLRSSNLSVAGLMAFSSRGLISLSMAIPLILGANVGSAAAILAGSLRRNREARRLALVQILFQVFGGVWLIGLTIIPYRGTPLILAITEWIVPGRLFHPTPENTTHHIAMLYTFFHLVNGLIFLGLIQPLLRLAERLIPRDPVKDNIKPYRLDPNLVEVPSLALQQAAREVTYLVELVRKAVAESFDAFRYRDLNLSDQSSRREESINNVHREISQYLLRVTENGLALREASRLECLQAAAGNLPRIASLGEHLRDLTSRALELKVELPEDILKELTELYDLVMAQFENVLHLLESPDRRIEENAVKVGERLAKSVSRIESSWIQRTRPAEEGTPALAAPPAPAGAALLLARDAYESLVLAAQHLSHIAERMRVLGIN